MGKRHSTYTGLSRFVLEAFGTDQGESSKSIDTSETQPRSNNTEKKSTRSVSQLESEPTPSEVEPPHKKRKTGLLGPGYEEYDATGLVTYYTDAADVPEHLKKYFFQRERYFSLYSSGCLLDEEGWYSVTPELIANQIAERCRCGTILDAFCGVGGNAIAFAQTCERVIAIDTSPIRLALARHNAAIYGVVDRIEFIQADYLEFARSYLSLPPNSSQKRQQKIDVVFLSPPWGGPEYISGDSSTTQASGQQNADGQSHPEFSLASIQPRNTNLQEISNLLLDEETLDPHGEGSHKPRSSGSERVEVEEEWMGSKLKALTCYFGGLATGQEDLFEQDM